LTVTDARGATSTDTVTASPTAPQVNHAPVAHATTTGCTDLSCTFDASASNDPDGDTLTYAWDFGDGSQGTGANPTHAYKSSGSKTVTLTVTDPQGLTSKDTVTAAPTDPAFTDKVTFVDAASTQGNRSAHKVTVPATVKAGDTLLLFFVGNTQTPVYTGPSGWTSLEVKEGDGTVGRVWTKTATATDAGSAVTVTTTDSAGATYLAKDAMTVAAYRGTSATNPVVASASALQTTSTTVHTTPTVTAPDGHEWLVSYWADKSTNTTAITGPSSQTSRSSITSTTVGSSGHITGLLADSAGVVGSGTQGGLDATADSAGSAAQTFSILLGSS
jgi:PKD repeat protein